MLPLDSDVQAYDAGLASIAGLTTAADKVILNYGHCDTYAVTSFTAFGRSLVDDADAVSGPYHTLVLAQLNADTGTSANNVVQLDGSARLPELMVHSLTNSASHSKTHKHWHLQLHLVN